MDETRRDFLFELLDVASPAGFETAAQRVWVDYVSEFADEVRTDAYGNAVAVYDGGEEASGQEASGDEASGDESAEVAFVGHADEIGFMVSKITDDGFLRVSPIGSVDRTVTEGTQIEIHTDDGVVNGVIGQTAIHLRGGDDEPADVTEQHVDIGAEDGEHARELVSIGDPATPAVDAHELAGSRLAGRGIDNRAGIWVAAEGLRRAAERDAEATVYAVSTVQEELGKQGAKMVAFDLDPDVAIAVDVTHAADNPTYPGDRASEIALGDGPTVSRGAANHPVVVEATRDVAEREGIDIQAEAISLATGTDADAFFTARSGIPTIILGIPNRYMHTPVEVVDTDDLTGAADVLAAFAAEETDRDSFAVDV